MNEALSTSNRWISGDSRKRTGSPELAAGPTPFDLQACPTTLQSGPAHAPVNHSVRQENEKDSPTPDISGPSGCATSRSQILQSSLESRLRARMDINGSILFTLTWKPKTTPSGRRLYLLRAQARRTAGIASFTWPTPRVRMTGHVMESRTNDRYRNLETAVSRMIWPTPTANRRSGLQSHGRNAILGVVNPAWILWLMGYPTQWLSPLYEPSVTPLSRKSPRNSSKQPSR